LPCKYVNLFVRLRELTDSLGKSDPNVSDNLMGLFALAHSSQTNLNRERLDFGGLMDELSAEIAKIVRKIPELIPWGKSELDMMEK